MIKKILYFHKNNCSTTVFRILSNDKLKNKFVKAVVYEIETNFKNYNGN